MDQIFFYSHFNEQFYCSHPSIYVLIDNVLKLQNASYIKIRNIKQSAPHSRFEKEKVQLLIKYHQSYVNGEMARDHYARAIGFKYQARVDLKLVY